ncbi:hypothetical protein ONZ43_g1430 [Nemania bipapillata]|uniref:Uncharacterized protein n=1 Tax=Nemania bipapillata TaxID=110536 RepID=A0ACC2J4K2_9PEZI|nr:hypothetical protein ONZ43_g1430 [Nemania bipapillata]
MTSLRSDHVGRTLLHWAMDYNWDIDKIGSLKDFSASNLDAQDRDGQTAMHLAVLNRNLAAIERLTFSGASCFLKDKNGMTPVHLAADIGYRDALNYFVNMHQKEFGTTTTGATLLHIVALWIHGGFVSRLVELKGASVNAVDESKRTPLHYAAMNNNWGAVEELVGLHSIVNARDINNMTPLHEAIR